MDSEADFSQYKEFLKKYWLPLVLASLGLIFFIYGLIHLSGVSKSEDVDTFPEPNLASKSASLIAVDIEGAVSTPGVYKLTYGSIMQDALVLANGLSADADREYVAKNINLASKLTDGEKIYIPKAGEATASLNTSSQNQGLIDINSASETQLDSLPGIGPVTAGKIIGNRPYQSIDDLLNEKIVTSKIFLQIKDKIAAY